MTAQNTREWLRSLPVFETPAPDFDPEQVPEHPVELFLDWLRDAADAGVPAAHAVTVATSTPDGPTSRVVILKDVDADGWQFATNQTSPKGRALAADPRTALTFFWPSRGRQVRVLGVAEALPAAESAEDFLARPVASRAASIVGKQSEALSGPAEYREAADAARELVQAEPGALAAGWTVYRVRPTVVEFWQASRDRAHVRVEYRRDAGDVTGAWTHGMLWP